jgi:hypothetical protein
LTLDDGGWSRGFWLSCIGLAVTLCLAGLLTVVRRGFVLKKRIDAYRDLPVVVLASFTGDTLARIREASHVGAELLPRAQRALVDLQEARDSLERSAATVSDGARAVGRFFSSRN